MGEVFYGFARGPFETAAPRIVFGWGVLNDLGQVGAELGFRRTMLVTDRAMVELGIAGRAIEAMADAGIETRLFDSVEPEPSVATTQRAADLIRSEGADSVVGLGGGSCLDVAKAAAAAARQERYVRDFLGMDRVPGAGWPKILIPTTAGTGSEVTHISVLTDTEDQGAKKVMYSRHLQADVALVDPELTVGLPPRITAASGLDALTHAIEGYVSTRKNPFSDLYSERAIRLIGAHLRQAVLKGRHSPEARYSMSLAATLAGLSFANSSVGAVHAVSLPFGVKYGVGHGESNAVVLPHVMRYSLPSDIGRFRDIALWLGVPDTGDGVETAERGVEAVYRLVRDCGLEPRLSAYGVKREDFPAFADLILRVQGHNLERNTRDLSREDLLAIYEMAY